MKLLISALISVLLVSTVLFLIYAIAYDDEDPIDEIIQYGPYTIDCGLDKSGKSRTIISSTPVIKEPDDGSGAKNNHTSFVGDRPASRRPLYIRPQYEDGDTILMEDGTVIVVEDDICGDNWDPIPRRQKKLKLEPFYVDPSSIPEIMGNPGKFRR